MRKCTVRELIFDLLLPRILTKEKLSFADIAAYGHGGTVQ